MTVAVIGAGAAGLLAAGAAAEAGASVLLFEKNAKVGRKIMITGKGRCNVTNDCDVQTVLANIPVNPRFLYSALMQCTPADMMDFFQTQGVKLKTERGARVFPVSDKALDIVDALFFYVKKLGVRILFEHTVTEIITENGAVCGVRVGQTVYAAERVIVATGGASYPATGSTGDGYAFARALGHTIVSPRPSLVPLVSTDGICEQLMGLSLRNVKIRALEDEKVVYEDFGEMLFTHFGVSGPLILSASAHMRHFGSKNYRIEIDLKPALDAKMLDKRLLSDFDRYKNSDFINALGELLPRKLIPVVIACAGIDPRVKVHSITKTQRQHFVRLLKAFPVHITGARPLSEAIITTGGVSVGQVNPKDMQSKKVSGLYFAGEVLDVDAYTGGFNLQIAWATGRLAGKCAAEEAQS